MKKILFASFAAMCLIDSATAQISNCDAFIQGNHVEAGVNFIGAFGTSTAAPSGYHSRLNSPISLWKSSACGGGFVSTTLGLGFVADPNLTGWTSYFGDYYMPGMPQEGWLLQVGSQSVTAYTPTLLSSGATVAGLTSANISCTATATTSSTLWEGVFDSMKITQITSIDTGDLFFRVKIMLTNLSVRSRDSVYYLRTVDPDNEQTVVGSAGFTTINKIDHQMPGDPDSVVSVTATGTTHGTGLALATKDYRAKCCFFDAGLAPSYTANNIYWGATPYNYTLGTTDTIDVGMALVFYIPHIASVDSAGDSVAAKSLELHPANTASFSFIYSFKPSDVINQLDVVHPVVSVSEYNTRSVSIYPNPNSGSFQIQGMQETDKVELYDVTGRAINANFIKQNGSLIQLENSVTGNVLVVVKNNGVVIYRQLVTLQ
jgi:hypothetical protein